MRFSSHKGSPFKRISRSITTEDVPEVAIKAVVDLKIVAQNGGTTSVGASKFGQSKLNLLSTAGTNKTQQHKSIK
jgi:hypothetical protein